MKKKILTLVIGVFTFVLLLQLVVQVLFIIPFLDRVEMKYAYENAERLRDTFHREIDLLEMTNADWAYWNDTVNFIQTKNRAFLESSLNFDGLSTLRINVMALFNKRGKLIWGAYWDREHESLVRLNTSAGGLKKLNDRFPGVLSLKESKGMILWNDKPMLYSTKFITPSVKRKPVYGFFFQGRIFDKVFYRKIKSQLKLDFKLVKPVLGRNGIAVNKDNSELLLCDVALGGSEKKALVQFRFQEPREIRVLGFRVVYFILLVNILGAAVIVSLYIWMLNGFVIKPLSMMIKFADDVIKSKDYSLRIDYNGKEEVVKVAHAFDMLLSKVQKQTNDLIARKERLSIEAGTDVLTQISNRKSFGYNISRELKSAAAAGHSLSLIFIDIDYFKKYNDRYGHPEGDECLKRVAATLKKCCGRPDDHVSRYGGDVFAIILPVTDTNGAKIVAEKALNSIRKQNIKHEDSPFGIVTISIGVASIEPDENSKPEYIIKMADVKLYEAKKEGRNRGC